MIVKMRTDGMYNDMWEVISDITSFRYAKITEQEAYSRQEKGGLNNFIHSLHKNNINNNFVYLQAWHKRSSDPINMVSNQSLFILNDEGKTVERIN